MLLWLFTSVVLLYMFSAGSNFTSGDSYAELHVTASLLDHRWFDVPVQQPGQVCAGWGCRGSDGRYYASHGIGNSLALVPFYAVAQGAERLTAAPGCADPFWRRCVPIQLISMNTSLFSAATVTLLALFGLELGYGAGAAVATALLYGFAGLAWPYARFGFDVTLSGLLLLAAARSAWWAGLAPSHRAVSWLSAGVFSGLAVLVRLPTAAALLPLFVWWWLTSRESARSARVRWLLAFLLPLAAAGCWTAWYNTVRFGSIVNDGHAGNAADRFSAAPWTALVGMLISPGKGLLWYCPVLLLLFFTGGPFLRRYGLLALLCISVAAASVLPYIAVADWYGGSAWGPRFLLPVLPLLFLPMLELPGVMSRLRLCRLFAWPVIGLSLLLQVAGQFVSYGERLQVATARGHADQIFWDPRYSPIPDHLGTLLTDLRAPAALQRTVPPAQASLDVWWLDLWRIHGVPPGPSMLAGAVLGMGAVAAVSRLRWRLACVRHDASLCEAGNIQEEGT